MQKIKINIQEPYFTFLLNGQKTVEGRLNKGKFAQIGVGDILIFENCEQEFLVTRKKVYQNFYEMIESEGVKNVIPDKNNINDAVAVYYQFYTKQQEKSLEWWQ